jgi:hypothetical protein
MVTYWLARGGQQYGPYTVEDLTRMAAQGTALANDLVWKEGMADWAPLSTVVPMQAPPSAGPGYAPSPGPTYPSPGPTYPPAGPQYPPAGPGYPPSGYPPPLVLTSPRSVDPGLIPPSEHWGLIMALGAVTCGIVPVVWMFKQANFAKRLDPQNRSTLLLALGLIVMVASMAGLIPIAIAANERDEDTQAIFLLIVMVLNLAGSALLLVGYFKVRRSMLNYFNQVDPINLRLSGAMTFFFNIYYFQHHFRRIARWKQTGFLEPQ